MGYILDIVYYYIVTFNYINLIIYVYLFQKKMNCHITWAKKQFLLVDISMGIPTLIVKSWKFLQKKIFNFWSINQGSIKWWTKIVAYEKKFENSEIVFFEYA